jgi:prepilin-type N-terminal cleavage/methylation domain-containing protein/prepilin-type processing-associated H-X9-DG protein
MAKRRPAGFSLVELLVVITIIGMLVALLLPAVQAAREAARRATCLNNLHQIGLGLQNYHSVHASFPPGCIQPAFMISNGRQFAWSALLLPYIEQQPLSTAIDFSQPCYAAVNAAPAAVVLSMYVCPSNARSSAWVEGRAATDYSGLYGENIPPHPAGWVAENGMMVYDQAFRIRDVTDGTSNTLIVAENSRFPVLAGDQWINGLNIMDADYAINYIPPNPQLWEHDIRSEHPGGANAALCDGSARFLSETLDVNTLKAILTRAGGEVVGPF